jgi:hypothetical protein
MHKNAMKCNKTQSKWCKNKHGAYKIIDMFETYQCPSKRDQSLVAQPGILSCPHFLGVGPSHWSKPFTVLLHTMHAHPIHASRVPLIFTPIDEVSRQPLADHHRPQRPWPLRGPTHVHVVSQDLQRTVAGCLLTCERKKLQMTFLSHSKSPGRHGFYGARIIAALFVNS